MKKSKKKAKSAPKKNPFFNKYVLSLCAFVIWISFFDHFSLITQNSLSNTVSILEDEKKDYELKLEDATKKRDEIHNDKERFAREQYLQHKENEQVIIIPTAEKKK